MKKKKSIWLAIVTLVLCIGVMATGIYAAKTAMLKLGGTLGFNMNNCLVEVSGTISNIAVKNTQTGAYTKEVKNIENAIMGGESQTVTSLDLGALDFYAGEDMIFELTFKNLSAHTVIAVFDAEYSNEKVVEVESSLYDSLPSTKIITKDGSITLTFALHLTDESAVINGFAFNLTAKFEEQKFQKDAAGNYYLEMGTEDGTINGTPLKWYAFAKQGTNGTYEAYTPNKTYDSGSYYFISEYALASIEWVAIIILAKMFLI